MKAVEAYDSAYPSSMSEREDGGFIRRDDAESLVGSLLALIKSGDRAAEALIEAKKDAALYLAALAALISSDVGQQTLAELAEGFGTNTDDGRAWMRAAEMVRPNEKLRGRAL